MAYLQVLIVFLAITGLLYHGAPLWVFTVSVGGSVLTASWMGVMGLWSLPVGTSLIIFAICFHVPNIRRQLLTRPLFAIFRSRMPPMSDTEQAAIEAGDIWWDAQLLQGRPDWESLLSFQTATLSEDELQFIEDKVKPLMAMVNEWEVVEERKDLSPEVWERLLADGYFGMAIPKSYGGLEFSAFAQSTIISMLGVKSPTLAGTAMVPNSLGPAELLQAYGTTDQKDFYLPRLASGDQLPCFALTSPEAGSDAGAIPDTAVVCKGQWEGKEIIGIRLNWNKRYITLAPVATVMGLAVKLFDPDQLLSQENERGITVCLIPTDLPGIDIGKRHLPGGVLFQNGPIRGEDVFVPLDTIIGGVDMIGQGWRMLVESLSAGRGISLPALSTAASQLAYRSTASYASIRTQFGMPIGQFEGVQAEMAKIAGNTYRIEAMRQLTASAVSQHLKPSVVTAIAKYHMTEMAREAISVAMDVHGGKAVMRGPSNYITECHSSAPVMITVEGANILTRNLMIFGQGAIRCHPYVQSELMTHKLADSQPEKALLEFDKLFFAHIRYFISNGIRTLSAGLTHGLVCSTTAVPTLTPYMRRLNWMSCALAFATDYSMFILGGDLKRKERLSARLGDVLSHLYIASAVVKYNKELGFPATDEDYVHWSIQKSLYECQEAFYDLTGNFPVKGLGWVLRRMIFPFGKAFSAPNDALEAKIVQQMMTPSAFRSRLTCCYTATSSDKDALGCLEKAVEKQIAAQSALKALKGVIKSGKISKSNPLTLQIEKARREQYLSEEELVALEQYDEVRVQAIAVDEFAPSYFENGKHLCKNQTQTEVSTW